MPSSSPKPQNSRFKIASLVVAVLLVFAFSKYFEDKSSNQSDDKSALKNSASAQAQAQVKKNDELEKKPQGVAVQQRTVAMTDGEKQLEAYLKKWQPGEDFSIDLNPAMKALVVSNGSFLIEKNREREFLKGLAEVAQISAFQFSQLDTSTQATGFSSVSSYQQAYNGFSVENSEFKMFRKKADNRIYYMTSSLRPVVDLNENIQVTKDQAARAVLGSYSQPQGARIIQAVSKPVILNETQAVLVWKFIVEIKNPIEERLVYVATATGEIIYSSSILEH